jgi:hypothetical protein
MTLYDVLLQSATAGLKQLSDNGSMPAGHNGPYQGTETPVRNTAHWLIVFAKAYEITQSKPFILAVEQCANYLSSQDARPLKSAFYCRKSSGKDLSNGLIGQAWVFEALQKASDVLKSEKYRVLAKDVFLQHFFSEDSGCWHTLNVDGSYRSVDVTFNHQLWFAACSAGLASGHDEIRKRLEKFVDSLEYLFKVRRNGLIVHCIPSSAFDVFPKGQLKGVMSLVSISKEEKKAAYIKEIGYHAFNLYAFAILKTYFPTHPFWSSSKFIKAISFIQSDEYLSQVWQSPFAFSYNPPGIECAYAISVFHERFSHPAELISAWLTRQILETYEESVGFMWRKSSDRWTCAARIYEMTRIADMEFSSAPQDAG